MRALSLRQAQHCETAANPKCRCRCGGALHGRFRSTDEPDALPDQTFFETLPDDDPHHLLTTEEKRVRAKLKRKDVRETYYTQLGQSKIDLSFLEPGED